MSMKMWNLKKMKRWVWRSETLKTTKKWERVVILLWFVTLLIKVNHFNNSEHQSLINIFLYD